MKVKNWKSGTGNYKIDEINIKQGELVTNLSAYGGSQDLGDGVYRIYSPDGSSSGITQSSILTVNKYYRLTYTVDSFVSGTLGSDSGFGNLPSTVGTHNINSYVTSTTLNIKRLGVTDIQISNVSVTEIPPLPDLDNGAKFLENTTSGTAALPSKQAYGTWEFDLYKGASGNTSYIYPILDGVGTFTTNNGYIFYFKANESISFDIVSSTSSTVPLLKTTTSYINNNTWYRIKVARLKSEGVFKDIETLQESDIENGDICAPPAPYTTFTDSSRYGFKVTKTDSGTLAVAGTADEIPFVNGSKYLIEFDMKLNSGDAPYVYPRSQLRGTEWGSPTSREAVNGRNSMIFTATSTGAGVIEFRNYYPTNYEISGLTIRQIYPADTFAVFIKGGDFGTDKWTLVDTTGGSGSNPISDNSYTESSYLVCDLDSGDKISNIKITNGVKQ